MEESLYAPPAYQGLGEGIWFRGSGTRAEACGGNRRILQTQERAQRSVSGGRNTARVGCWGVGARTNGRHREQGELATCEDPNQDRERPKQAPRASHSPKPQSGHRVSDRELPIGSCLGHTSRFS